MVQVGITVCRTVLITDSLINKLVSDAGGTVSAVETSQTAG